MATTFGAGAFGITAESGILIQNISFNEKQDKKEVRGTSGDVVGITYYNETIEVKMQGILPTTSAFSTTLAATLVLANSLPDHLKGATTGGSLIVEEVNITYSNEGYKEIEVSAVYYPSIASA
jgi:hypothetical protein